MKECCICKTTETPQWYANSTCKSCYRKKHRQANKEAYAKRDKENYEANKDHILARQKQYYKDNSEECKERSKNRRKLVGDQRRPGYFQEYKNKNREAYNRRYKFFNAKRRAALKKATPSWLTQEHWDQIREIYENCPKGHEVDHVMPLQGKELCGLHVPWNLQYLTTDENRRKKNKVK